MTRGIRLTGFLAMALLAALVVFLSADDTQAAPPPFEPGGMTCFENMESTAECDGDSSPGVATDIRSKFCIGWNADCSVKNAVVNDSNFGGVVGFTPEQWGLPKGDTIPIGAIAGRLDSAATLGLLNKGCSTPIPVGFTMLNASINVNDQIKPRPEGAVDVMQPLAMDGTGNGIPDGADKYPSFLAEFFSAGGSPIPPRARLFGISHIQGSWVTLNFVFFEKGVTLEIAETTITFEPTLGYPSITILQDPTAQAAPSVISDFCAPLLSSNLTLGKTINNPCSPTSVEGANCPVTSDEVPDIKEVGYPSMPCDPRSSFDDDGDGKVNDGCPQRGPDVETGAQCDNAVTDDTDGAINDGCPQFGEVSEGARIPGTCTGGDEGGCDYRTNPATGGAYNFVTMALSQRDADGDGIENSLDVCFKDINGDWNPRMDPADVAHDSDSDGLPNACDPNPDTAADSSPLGCKSGLTGADEDQDCFANRADNCPTVEQIKDPNQPVDNDPVSAADNPPLAPDDDSDGIGNACDPDPNAPNGDYIGYCMTYALNVGGAVGPVTAVRQTNVLAPDCAAAGPVQQPTQGASIVTATPRAGPTQAGGSNGVSGPASGVGSLSPTATDFPVWAAILAGIGAAGVVSGLALYKRLAPRKQR